MTHIETIETEKIKKVFELAGFSTVIKPGPIIDNLLVETYQKKYLEIANEGDYAYFDDTNFSIPKNSTLNNVENRKKFIIDYDVESLKAVNFSVISDNTSITILGTEGNVEVKYDECGGIYDFIFHKRPIITLGRMGSMIGSGCNTLHNKTICARIEKIYDFSNGICTLISE